MKLENLLLIKSIFGALKIAASFLSILGPQGALIGSIAQAGLNIAETVITADDKGVPKIFNSSEKVLNSFSKILKIENKKKLEKIQNDLNALEFKEGIKKSSFKEHKLFQININSLSDSSQKYELQLEYFDYLKIEEPERTKEVNEKIASTKDLLKKAKETEENIGEYTEKALVVVNTAKMGYQLYSEIKKSQNEIKLIEEQIHKNAKQYEKLHEFESLMNVFHNNVVKEFQNGMNNIRLGGKSLASLDFIKFEIKSKIDDFKNLISQLVNTFESKTEIMNTINRIDRAITIMIEIHARVENYIEHIQFAKHMSDLTKKEGSVGIPTKYQSEINSLKKTITANIIKESYDKALEAFKYWSFPFFCEYTQNIKLNDDSDLNVKKYADDLNKLLRTIKISEVSAFSSFDNHFQHKILSENRSFNGLPINILLKSCNF